jgi:hypothetical protein
MTYLVNINGERVVRGVVRTLPDGRRVRLHGVSRWGRVFWTADKWGETWADDRSTAIASAPDSSLDLVI